MTAGTNCSEAFHGWLRRADSLRAVPAVPMRIRACTASVGFNYVAFVQADRRVEILRTVNRLPKLASIVLWVDGRSQHSHMTSDENIK